MFNNGRVLGQPAKDSEVEGCDVNERLMKAKKQGAFLSLIAYKSITKSLHCLSMRLIEERTAHSEKYIDEGKPTPPEVNIYHCVVLKQSYSCI